MKKLISLAISVILTLSSIPYVYAIDENGVGEVYYQNDFSTTEKVSEVNNDAEYQEDGTMKMSQKSLYKLGFGTQNLPNINTNKATIEIKLAFKSGPVSWMGYMFGLYDGDTTTGARVRLGYDDYNKTFTITAVKNGAGEWDESLVKSNSMSMNDWHKLCLVTDNGNYDLYLDGEKITTQSLGLNSTGLTNVTATNYMNSGDYCGVYFDDILVKETGTMALRSSSVENNAVDVDVDTEKIELTFENPLTATSTDGITIDGLTTSDYSVSIDQVNDARKAVITLNNTLEGSTAYTVNYNVNDYMGQTVSGSINFTTAASKPVQTTVSVKPENGAANVNAYSPIVFTYNKNIDTKTVPTELKLSNGRKANITVSGKTITVLPVNPLAISETITVELPDVIKDEEGKTIPASTTTYTTMADSVYYEHVFRDRDNAEQTTAEFPASQYLINDPGENITGGNGLLRNDGEVVLIYKFDQGIDLVEAMEYCGAGSANVGEIKYYISDVRENIISEDNIITVSESTDETIDGKKYEKKIFNGDGKQKYFAAVVNAKNYLPQLQYVKFNQSKPETVVSDIPTAVGNSVTFTMNSRLDADSVSADKFEVEGESVLSAVASGNKLTLVFNALDFQKTYTVTAKGVKNIYSMELSELKFITPAAEVTPPDPVETTVAVMPASGAVGVNAYSPIVFTYNKNIDKETVPTELTLSNGKKAYVNVSDNTITVQPINPKADTQSVTVTLPDTIKDSNGEDIPESTTTYTTMADSVYYEHVFRDRDNAEQTTAEFPASQYLINDPGENITGGNGLLRNDGEVVLIYKFDQGIDLVEAMEYCRAGSANVGEIKYYISDVRENIISEDNIITVSESTDETIDGKKYEKKIFNGDGKQKYFAAVVNAKNYLPQLQYLKFNQPKPDTVTADVSTAVGNSVTFTMNSRLDADSVSADKFKVDGESVLSAVASGNKLTLVFRELDFQKTYTVTAEGVTNIYSMELSELNFITPKAIEVLSSGIQETDLTGTTATGKATVKNNSPEEQNIMVAAAYYDGDQMLGAKVKTVSVGAGQTQDIELEALNITAANENNRVKVFVWLAQTQQPVADAFVLSGKAQNE